MNKYDYDVVIIGAGISGLVCGCYLAKAGLKTLIVEKNYKPGGYCTSFKRNGFHFDACVHSLGSLGERGILTTVLQELNLIKELHISRYDPSDIIVTPHNRIHFWNDLNKTIHELQDAFPEEHKNTTAFFKYLNDSDGILMSRLRGKTFAEVLDEYIHNNRLKAVISLLLLGNIGLPVSLVSAFTAIKFYRQFILDGGYYPTKGMQELPDVLVRKFKKLGGVILSPALVTKIKMNDNRAEGVVINNDNFISSDYIISACDAMQTFFSLIGEENIGKKITNKLHKLIPSLSMFILYLVVDKEMNGLPMPGINLWSLPNYDVDHMYSLAINGKVDKLDWFLLRMISNKRNMLMFVNAPFINEKYWKVNKERTIDMFTKKIERIVPNLSKHIIYKDAATPYTLYNQTLNYKGAAYGWASMPTQFADPDFSQVASMQNLYLTGHWSTLAQGIPGVVYLGRETAQMILYKKNKS